MIALAAALSVAASLAIDVPYLPQSEALCGGAAAAMVFRFWGDTHADPQEFARLIDRRAGGIAEDVLTEAMRARGWRVARLANGMAGLRQQLDDGLPVILLLAERRARYHYVVATSGTSAGIVIHDPSWGPSREIKAAEFERRWQAAGYWGLVVRPPIGGAPLHEARAEISYSPTDSKRCAALLSGALEDVRRIGFDHADTLLDAVRKECPDSSGAWRELAGVRFAQKRWADASTLARAALDRDPQDPYAWDLLGSSLFIQDDVVGALRAWNRIDKPHVNLVRIEGLRHTRYETLADLIAIRPNALLTADAFARAQRRLDALPDRTAARLAVRPESDGFATVEVVVAERDEIPRNGAEWAAGGARAAVTRSIDVDVPGKTGQGEMWSADWRFWPNRPRVGLAFSAPRVAHLPGSWRIEGAWEAQTYLEARAGSPLRQSRTHGALTMSDWLSGHVRYSVTAGLDAWDAGRKAAAFGGALEQRWLGDRASLEVHATDWVGLGAADGFRGAGWRVHLQSSADRRGWVLWGTAGTDYVTDRAPMDLWLAADDGHVGAALLRAHPILDDGVIATGGVSAFGRSLTYATAEAQRWFDRPLLPRIAVAGFVDVARASRRVDGDSSPANIDVGGGVRFRIPGQPGVLRVDVARGVRDGANALTVGWQF